MGLKAKILETIVYTLKSLFVDSIEPCLERCAKQKKLVRSRTQEERPLKHRIRPFSEHIEPSGRLRNILYMK